MLWNRKGRPRIKGKYYWFVKLPEHPKANKNGWVLEHTVVAENKLGRRLRRGEEVHHKDGNSFNNHPDNLEILTREEHLARHGKKPNKKTHANEVSLYTGEEKVKKESRWA